MDALFGGIVKRGSLARVRARCGGIMAKTGKQARAVRGTRMPGWIRDKENQRKWNGRFVEILKKYYLNSDSTISAILVNERLSQVCATKIRSYVDKGVTEWWYRQSKARGTRYKATLKTAIGGLRAANDLCLMRGKHELASSLGMLADEFSLEVGRCKAAFATKQHGRDRDHSFLLECQSFLRKELGRSVSYVTLTNLVNAGYEAEGSPPKKEPITEDQIRKNLAHFRRNNPHWRLYSSMK
jgi:hypothetical protein